MAAPAEGGIAVAVVGDGRHLPVPLPINHDVATLLIAGPGIGGGEPDLQPVQFERGGAVPGHPSERSAAGGGGPRAPRDGRRAQV